MEINVSYGLTIQKDDIRNYLDETIKQITDDLNSKVNNYYIEKEEYDKLKAKYNKAVLRIAIEEQKDWEEIDKMLGE